MPFVWGVNLDFELEINLFTTGNDHVAQVAIGYDESSNTISVFVAISPLPGMGHEYIFCILEAEPDGIAEYRYWDGLGTRRLFGEPDRETVLNIVLAATDQLLERISFEEVNFTTYEPDLPEKALRKHYAVLDVFRRRGYEIITGDPYHGRHIWFARRLS